MSKKKISARYIAVVAMFAAIAYLMVFICEPIPKISGFLSYEPKDVMIVMAGFIFGPLTSVLISVIVSVVEMLTFSETGLIGLAMNVISSCSFALPAVFIYKRFHTKKGAIGGLAAGVAAVTLSMALWNYVVTPLYMEGVTRDDIAGMLVPVFVPFNLIKSGLNSVITVLIYSPVVTALRKTKLVERPEQTKKKKYSIGSIVAWAAAGVTLVMLFLLLAGKI